MIKLQALMNEVAHLTHQTPSKDITRLFKDSLDVALTVPPHDMQTAQRCFNVVMGAMLVQPSETRQENAVVAREYADKFSTSGQGAFMTYLRSVADNLELK